MRQHGMGIAAPVGHGANRRDGRHAEVQRGTESHLQKQSLSHMHTRSHSQQGKHHHTFLYAGYDSEAVAAVDAPEGRRAQGRHI